MTTEPRNEAAERVRAFIDKTPSYPDVIWQHEGSEYFEEALSAERRATVERISQRIDGLTFPATSEHRVMGQMDVLGRIQDILDEEASR